MASNYKETLLVGAAICIAVLYLQWDKVQIILDNREPVPIQFSVQLVREGTGWKIWENGKFRFNVSIYHSAANPISGRVIIRAYGDVFGKGGENTPEAENYKFKDIVNAPPGESGGFTTFFYIKNPLLDDDVPMDIKMARAKNSKMQFYTEFQPSDSETHWKKTTTRFEMRDGKLRELHEKN
jgi:hypothetical protein